MSVHEGMSRAGGDAARGGSGDHDLQPFRMLLGAAAAATLGIALWLVPVILVVLPAHDPARIPLWRGIAIGFFGHAVLSAALLARPRNVLLRGGEIAASLGALGLGGWAIAQMIARAQAGRDFEGYVVVMGLVLVAHGLAGLMVATLGPRAARSPRTG